MSALKPGQMPRDERYNWIVTYAQNRGGHTCPLSILDVDFVFNYVNATKCSREQLGRDLAWMASNLQLSRKKIVTDSEWSHGRGVGKPRWHFSYNLPKPLIAIDFYKKSE